ncbi:Unknown protein, partial [Striga hermonthica]
SRKIRVNRAKKEKKNQLRKGLFNVYRGKKQKNIQRLRKVLFSNTTPIFDVDNIYFSHHHVSKQIRMHLKKR